ncbi:putative RNA-directed DNA polymerase [Tanacetum coccineum]
MHSRFEMSLMGEMKFFLGLQIHQSPKGIFINQAKYALEILKKHNMDNCHSIGTPLATKPKLDVDLSGEPVDQSDYRSKIGSLMYLTSSRPDLVLLCTLSSTTNSKAPQGAFSDADHAGCLDTRKSTSGGIQFLGDKLVSWMSKKQNCTAMSLAEAEYVALSASCAQVMWMRTQLQDYGFNYNKIPLYCDSQSAIAISCNPVQHSHTKHIHTRPFREDKCLIRRENQCFIVLLSGALFQPHRRRDILSFMSITKHVFKGVEIFDQRGTYCKASVHIPKDERSKLDVKNKPCVFLGYGQDELGYRLYDPVQKKLVRSRDVEFDEDQTLKDVEKTEKETIPQHNDDPIDLDPVPPKHFDAQFGDDIQNDEEQNDEEHGADDVDAQEQPNLDEDVHPELPVPMPPFVPLRRSTRDHHPSTRYSANEYVLLTDGGEPECYAEAMEDEHKKEWFDAMQDEMKSLYENNTFELTKLPKGKRALKNKWVYKLKTEEYTPRPRYKARLVVKGFSQKKGIDFDEIFSPVVKMGSIRVVLGLAASLDLEVEQMDVKTAFLHGDLDKEIYMEQPEGFQVKGKEDYVCRLQKSLYGLKQAPRQWYKKFESVIGKQGFRKTFSDHCVFFQRFGDDDFIILLLYVDDMLIVGKNIGRIAQLKQDLSKSFAMKDLGPAKQILGIRIFRDRGAKKLHISQEQYIEKVLRRFNMDKAKVVSSPLTPNFKLTDKDCPSSKKNIEKMDRVPYASAVGSLMYAMVCTRPDLAHAVGVVSRFLSNPGKKHWEAVKWIFRYLRGTSKLGITFGNGKPMLVGYTDSDLAGNKDNMKSTSGYLMTFAGGAVSWQSRLQKCVALSTTEAEYVAATEACKELLWLKRFLQELGFKQQRYAVLCDNQSTIHLAKNSMFHKRTKHIDIRYHWIRDAIEDGMFELNKVHTDDNASDMLTKAVAREKLKICCSFAGMANSSS